MTREIPIYQIDAFAGAVFAGNPAAVCPLEAWLPDDLMQSIAEENNLSETAFLVPEGEGYALRWFTPAKEVDLCGHATLASAYVIANRLKPGTERIVFQSRSGRLEVTRSGDHYTLDFPVNPPEEVADDGAVAAALGTPPLELWRSTKLMAVLADEAAVQTADPNLRLVAALPSDGLLITAPGREVDFVSRYFAPAAGIDEDPVTGSAHCTLTPYWSRRLDKTKLAARQISRRGGELSVELRGDRVLISGRAVPFMEGRIHV